MMLPKHSAWLEKGPEERFPKSFIAYQPGLMQRTSDIISLMYWGVSTMAPLRSFFRAELNNSSMILFFFEEEARRRELR